MSYSKTLIALGIAAGVWTAPTFARTDLDIRLNIGPRRPFMR